MIDLYPLWMRMGTGTGVGGTIIVDMARVSLPASGELSLDEDADLQLTGDDDLDADGGDTITLGEDGDLEVGCE